MERRDFSFQNEDYAPHSLPHTQPGGPWSHFHIDNESVNINSDDENNTYSSSDSSSPCSDSDLKRQNFSPSVRNKRKSVKRTGRGKGFSNKNNRMNYSEEQLQMLLDTFENNKYPDNADIEHLSSTIDVPQRKLRFWFQNARARFRKKGNSRQTRPHSAVVANTKHRSKAKYYRKEVVTPSVAVLSKNYKPRLESEGDYEFNGDPTTQETHRGVSPVIHQTEDKHKTALYSEADPDATYPATDVPVMYESTLTPLVLPTMRQLLFDESESSAMLHSGTVSSYHSFSPEQDVNSLHAVTSLSTAHETSNLLASSAALLAQNCEPYSMYDYMYSAY